MFEQDQNPFKRMQGDLKDVPPELRQKVMNDVAMAKLIMEMATLFTSNYGSLIESLLKTKKTK
ncbi:MULTISPECIES: hypothetical protein [Maribacter]|jgi:hypothetical protein|uniref:Uncharacterized protein n=2 Tax=Maribacter TaxID=252356 RepID=A0A5B2TNU6_9FLAO|nr:MULTISPECIES: hypothetical protein [Maribacter]KAA2215964.1 hypothetical protein F0361_17405 [Maribacter flavus]MDC6406805.1 hypothetical protein [Maribacter sp. PR66]MEE1973923.1 hypothetical protein [Maribacter flavus]TLF41550.1 hypothetical protein FEK29_16190 [Maribacter aurantiacus]